MQKKIIPSQSSEHVFNKKFRVKEQKDGHGFFSLDVVANSSCSSVPGEAGASRGNTCSSVVSETFSFLSFLTFIAESGASFPGQSRLPILPCVPGVAFAFFA